MVKKTKSVLLRIGTVVVGIITIAIAGLMGYKFGFKSACDGINETNKALYEGWNAFKIFKGWE